MKLITTDRINDLIAGAASNVRQRMHYNVHESLSDPVQRLFIAARLESYFRPHRHPEKWECAVVLRGLFDVLVFNDTGCVTQCVSIGPGAEGVGFEIPANTWHSWVPMMDESVAFEIKQGPYNALVPADFAVWAPEEGTAEAELFVASMRKAKIGDLVARQQL
jgi:cupin fold WbuC family metalloprotein